ncbi:tRNA 2-thiouridine(34) synthase MnmA [Candidatus Saccharibacteria bacterium]|nr:tRNA 2-thiouridine(34) synthase MnmA [Candidatus Saccharibacteria bacterium]
MSKTVFVGLSGGVDSSVSALLLKQAGYNVVGVYMKNWSKDLPGFPCPWKEDYQDAKRIAVQLGIDFKMFDFEREYFDKVVGYMLDGFKAGITPNPDIMCNQEIKFKLFFDTAVEQGADFIATGHYAQTKDGKLLKAVDDNKDQTYFLYRVSEEALIKTLFPIGHLTKPEVRKIAEENNLVTATKKESMGICFVGKVGIKEFLSQYVETEPGEVVDQNGVVIGEHDGAIFYTIGQRHGLDLGGGLPFYVTGKDMDKNRVFVTTDLNDKALWSDELNLTSVHWISDSQKSKVESLKNLQVRTRHRAKLVDCTMEKKENGDVVLKLKDQIRAITPGQSAVIYSGEVCYGGGIIY